MAGDGRLTILLTEGERYPPAAHEILAGVGSLDVETCPDQDAFIRTLASRPYDAVVLRLGLAMTPQALDAAPGLGWIVTATTGLDHIDLDAAAARNVRVISLRGDTAFLRTITSTAEHTFALILALARRLPAATAHVRSGAWSPGAFACDELAGRTLAIAGFGRLGSMVARYGRAFDMDVIATDTDPARVRDGGATPVPVEELLARADVLSLHLPLEPETAGWLSRDRIGMVRPGTVLVNTARGELIDEVALLDALREGRIAAAALDVLAGDASWDRGVPPDHPLVAYARDSDRLLITPHIGGAGAGSVARTRIHIAERFAEAVRRRPVDGETTDA